MTIWKVVRIALVSIVRGEKVQQQLPQIWLNDEMNQGGIELPTSRFRWLISNYSITPPTSQQKTDHTGTDRDSDYEIEFTQNGD